MQIETSGLSDCIRIEATHAPGELAPSFEVEIAPHLGTEGDQTRHLTWTPPASVTFTIGDGSWTCVPLGSPRTISKTNGVLYHVTYIPSSLYWLRYGRYGKHVVWVSAPKWQYDTYLDAVDTSEYTVYFRETDIYTAWGWTINDILSSLSSLINSTGQTDTNFAITSDLPAFHVPQPTVTLSKDQTILTFVQSLLPPNFTYVWDWQRGALHVALAEPSTQDFSIPPDAYDISYEVPEQLTYDSVILTGAPYKINHGMTLDPTGPLGSVSSRANTTLIETLPLQTETVQGYPQTTLTTRTIQTDMDGNPFAVLSETVEVTGPLFSNTGAYAGLGLIRRSETTNTYDHLDAIVYEAPRLTGSSTTTSGYITRFLNSQITTSTGKLFYLTEDYRVLDYDDYYAISYDERPDILGTAYQTWVDDYETITETKTYISEDDVTPDWPEGFEKTYTQQIAQEVSFVYGMDFSCLDNPQTALQQVAYQIIQAAGTSMGAVSTRSTTVQSLQKTVKLESPQSYVYEELRSRLNTHTKKLETALTRTRINSLPPSAPSRYRTEPLKATIGESGEKLITAYTSQIPTANPSDFERWAGKLYYELTHQRKLLTFSVDSYVLPQGYRIANGTVIGWTASQQGPVFQAQMTIS